MADPKKYYGTKITFDDGATGYLCFGAPKALYDGLKNDLGLDDVPGGEGIEVPAATFCDRLGVKYEKAAGDVRYGEVWCRPAKYSAARKNLTGTYRTFAIKGTYDPMDSSRN
ncbi:hypothetical protein ACE1CI_14660 [Aerosakkonemataceae cyanobacterium BLCC-F50]|uniref:Uncharacterized protein n=1 Tax=Floridaenema flaviceps BLCC-F50 TaxID=3153642 RepID=A0ABV4XR56_9CYAN